mmetsp:Transcript_5346/g.19556  ORF Transcript_5346/g.19556 Transcript_5346/m.19556 type:complete len:227 (-) Transcript_5346:1131-1811(-)
MQRDDGGRGLSDFDSYFGRWNRELQKNGRRWVHESPPSSNSDRSQPSRRGGKGDEAPPPSPFDEGDEGRGTDSAEGATTRISTLRLTLRWLLHSSQLKPSSRIGARCQETLLSGAYVLNGPRVSALNGFLSLCYRASPAALLAAMLLAFTVLALVYAALLSLEPAGCGPAGARSTRCRALVRCTCASALTRNGHERGVAASSTGSSRLAAGVVAVDVAWSSARGAQ